MYVCLWKRHKSGPSKLSWTTYQHYWPMDISLVLLCIAYIELILTFISCLAVKAKQRGCRHGRHLLTNPLACLIDFSLSCLYTFQSSRQHLRLALHSFGYVIVPSFQHFHLYRDIWFSFNNFSVSVVYKIKEQ